MQILRRAAAGVVLIVLRTGYLFGNFVPGGDLKQIAAAVTSGALRQERCDARVATGTQIDIFRLAAGASHCDLRKQRFPESIRGPWARFLAFCKSTNRV